MKLNDEVKPLGQLLAEAAPGFDRVNTTTTANPSEADIDGEGE
jgi:hypothetical protein